jgi:deoxyribose-phosphate aldolase
MSDDVRDALRAIALIDLTDLDDDSSAAAVEALCGRAVEHGTAAVCVWPDFVDVAVRCVTGSSVRVATVVDFPTGDERPHAVRLVTEHALADGADEIDVVLPYRAWSAGRTDRAALMLDEVRAAAADATVKVILETGALADTGSVSAAATFAIDHGADFVKTSTGKIAVSATPAAASAMLAAIRASGRAVGLKPSGGIRTLADARTYLALADEAMGADWATPATFRFGASGLLDALLAVAAGDADSGTNADTDTGTGTGTDAAY